MPEHELSDKEKISLDISFSAWHENTIDELDSIVSNIAADTDLDQESSVTEAAKKYLLQKIKESL